MKEDDSSLELLFVIIIGIPLSILLSLYQVFVVMKIVEWYKVPLVLNTLQWFGILSIISLLLSDCKREAKAGLGLVFKALLTNAFVLSFILGMMYILHFII